MHKEFNICSVTTVCPRSLGPFYYIGLTKLIVSRLLGHKVTCRRQTRDSEVKTSVHQRSSTEQKNI